MEFDLWACFLQKEFVNFHIDVQSPRVCATFWCCDVSLLVSVFHAAVHSQRSLTLSHCTDILRIGLQRIFYFGLFICSVDSWFEDRAGNNVTLTLEVGIESCCWNDNSSGHSQLFFFHSVPSLHFIKLIEAKRMKLPFANTSPSPFSLFTL